MPRDWLQEAIKQVVELQKTIGGYHFPFCDKYWNMKETCTCGMDMVRESSYRCRKIWEEEQQNEQENF